MISKLKTLIEECGSKKKIEECEEIVIEEIEEYAMEEIFYELPLNEVFENFVKKQNRRHRSSL